MSPKQWPAPHALMQRMTHMMWPALSATVQGRGARRWEARKLWISIGAALSIGVVKRILRISRCWLILERQEGGLVSV